MKLCTRPDIFISLTLLSSRYLLPVHLSTAVKRRAHEWCCMLTCSLFSLTNAVKHHVGRQLTECAQQCLGKLQCQSCYNSAASAYFLDITVHTIPWHHEFNTMECYLHPYLHLNCHQNRMIIISSTGLGLALV